MIKWSLRYWIYPLLLSGFFLSVTFSCKDDINSVNPIIINLPELTTRPVTNISWNVARSGGSITTDGGAKITVKGVCYSEKGEPTIADLKTSNGTDTAGFISFLGGLKANTLYYVRAYATNSKGTAYGNTVTFATTTYFTQGTGAIDIDGNHYTSIILGSQEWMVENLKVTRYQNGDTIPNVTANTAWLNLTDGACCDYDNNPLNSALYGKLYNFYVVDDSRYLCPAGWHVPTNDEWTTLTTYLGGENVSGGKMKETGTGHWLSPNNGATNESGFTALPAGIRGSFVATFNYIGEEADWWSSTEDDASNAWERFILFNDSIVNSHYYDKKLGLSVRCIKNK
jgi:uncharacterized protein (TIGR02145 family)